MLSYVAFVVLLAVTVSCQGQSKPRAQVSASPAAARQLLYLPERQQYSPELQYQLGLLDPQFQLPTFNFLPDKQPFPSIQPQLLYYPGAPQGQPFLLQPGSPPGNFLVPQQPLPGPNVILRDVPQGPVLVAGYPKPAHIPPIEKDAEEIPTNPAKIPPFPSKKNKPEKLETFDEPDSRPTTQPEREAGEAGVLAAADNIPSPFPRKPTTNSLRPGQRFFVLNGVPLFANYPFEANNPDFNLKYAEPNPLPVFIQQQQQQPPANYPKPGFSRTKPIEKNHQLPLQDLLFRNAVAGQISNVVQNDLNARPQYEPRIAQNLLAFNEPNPFKQDLFVRTSLPLTTQGKPEQDKVKLRFSDKDFKLQPVQLFSPGTNGGEIRYFQYQNEEPDSDAIVVEASPRDESGGASQKPENDKTAGEPGTSQAQPGAIALAGPGGVAAAGPRGTALVGPGGLAVASPQATAVAGPSKEQNNKNEEEEKEEKKPETTTKRERKSRRQ